MARLSDSYSSLLDAQNAEVRVRWLQLVVRNAFQTDVPRLRAFLHKHTSRMYTVPLYEDLAAGEMKAVAVEIFQQTQSRLHPNLRRTLQQILSQSAAAASQTGPAPSSAPTSTAIALPDVDVSA